MDFVRNIPFFQNMSLSQTKKLLNISTQMTYQRSCRIFNQGDLPSHVFIVMSGEFEITRTKKTQYTLIDPIHTDKLSSASKLETD